jgi:hypothetical protein
VPNLRFERAFKEPITMVFIEVIRMLALRRWDPAANAAEELEVPRPGTHYARQTSTALREGKVIEVIRPVSVTLHETLHDSPCRVRLRQRWRIDAVDAGTLLRLELRYQLNQAAMMRSLHWRQRLRRHCEKMLGFVRRNLERAQSKAEQELAAGRSATTAVYTEATRPLRKRR